MSTINLPGLLTGIDTNTLISQLMAVEKRTLNIYQKRVSDWEDKKDALGSLESKLSALRSTMQALSDANQLRAFNVASSDEDILTAEATNSAFEGNHTVRIDQLATADRWVQTAGLEYAEDYVSDQPGTFIYSYNGKEAVITTTATTTLEDLVGLINNDADNPGVTASLLNYGGAYHLVLSGNDAGSDYRISVNDHSTEVLQADTAFTVNSDNATLTTRIAQLDQFENPPFQSGEVITISGDDHYGNHITPVELELTENTKLSHLIDKIKQAFGGNVKVTLENGKIVVADNLAGDSDLSITLTSSVGGRTLPEMDVSTAGGTEGILLGFTPSDFTRSQVAQDSKIKVDGYPSGAAVSEVQQIAHSSAVTSGTFTLSYGGYTTVELDYDATLEEIQDAIDALPSVQPGDITVGGTSLDGSGTLTFTFASTLGDVSSILIDSSNLSETLAVTEQTKGVAVSEVQKITGAVASGQFTLNYGGYTTAAIDYNADASQIKAALEALPSVEFDDIAVSGSASGGDLTFIFKRTLGDVNSILINSSNLDVTITEQIKGVDEWINRSSNTVDDVLSGVALHLHDVTGESGEEITLTRDIASVKEKLSAMVGAYNAVVSYMKEKTGYNDVLKTAGILMGDYVVGTIRSQLYTPLIAQTAGFIQDIDSFLMPGQIGLQLESDGTISFDSNAFDEAIAEDYMGVLAVIGAAKTGSSDSNTIRFYQANSRYTTAGTYDVRVIMENGTEKAQIKLSDEDDSAWRYATLSGSIITGDSSFDENGNPVYPENGLQLSVDLGQISTYPYTVMVRVKQGFAGAMQDALDRILKTTTGVIDIDQEHIDDTIKELQDRIEDEQARLDRKQEQLVARFARMEKTLALLQSQMSALGLSS